ncbi:MAG: hypothetical protein AB7V13_07335 [Pseudorhodoplanes sp.]|uniref:hypothetical protein n=1 Tax=Pseudorhodoplanes sp. TaxID=1934341 RepID=UPI003D126685
MERTRDQTTDRTEERISRTEIQPDPQLQLSEGRASVLQIVLVAFACLLIVGMMIYGLNQPTSEGDATASAPPAQGTTATAPTAEPAPPTDANAGSENPAAPDAAAPQQQPAREPVPQQVKPGVVPDDSAR